MATLTEQPRPGVPTADTSDLPYLALRIDHRFVVGQDETAPDVVAEILARPCFAPIHVIALECSDDSHPQSDERSADTIAAYMRDEDCAVLSGQSSYDSEVDAIVDIETGRHREGLQSYPAPLISRVLLPHEPDQEQARIKAFRDLGAALRAVFGCISLEPTFREAGRLSNGLAPHMPLQQALSRPGMSERRFRERHGFTEFPEELGQRIPGPEWGVFLSGDHLAQLSPDVLQPGAVFARVERLADDLVYAQLTDDPADALRADYDSHLDRARDALAPILMDVSGIELG